MSTYEEEMAEYSATADEQSHESGGNRLPEGQYQAQIKISRVEKSQRFDNWQWFVVYEDLGGAGEQPMWYDLENEIGQGIARKVAFALGWEDAAKDGWLLKLKAVADEGFFLDKVVDINVRWKPGETRDFAQVFINKLHGDGVPGGRTAAPLDDDDIPF